MKSDFVAAASHELRTPLTSIRGYVHILHASAVAADPVSAEALAAIERQSDRLLRMIGNVLREAQLESGEPDNAVFLFDVHELVRQVAADFHTAADRVVNEVAIDLPSVACNRPRLQDVLTNLVDNALKYSLPPEPILVGAQVQDGMLHVWVRDRGIGIATEDQHRVFDRFFQVDQSSTRAYGGVGLGLHIVSGLVASMGGTVDVDSRIGEGSTFTVSIPLVPIAELDGAVTVDASRD
jgi:signal transduction histidine kinase